jgi:hypothetical protein
MRDADYTAFVAMLDQVCGLIGRGTYKPDAQNSALWFRALAVYDLEVVRRGFDAHVKDPQRGRYIPCPADIIGQIHATDSRPSADEAWAIALKATDETATVTWTDEIAEAWGIAKTVYAAGDEVGARMAFRDAYNRISSAAKLAGRSVQWWPSLGHDPSGREPEVQRAAAAGLLTHEPALMLQAPDDATLNRLASRAPPHAREALLALRAKLTAAQPSDGYVPSEDALEKARTADLKQKAQDLTDAYQREHT